ncbi:LANO_0H14312g1_1 [Lachancea nothofagi CBS 11611]|uniref:LANO_0H14312g1_1 n=1 Tax=Lachancea nothofagi CBS 11611 TaxID=1266666 RepID=A0A1G4KML1_9SACH|nr:LANO_0H14312g1_1 [Lachancea nothofagi CBS 11611]
MAVTSTATEQIKSCRSSVISLKKSIIPHGVAKREMSKEVIEERLRVEQIRKLRKQHSALESALKILGKFEKEREVLRLIEKWRSICQAGMSYLLNSTLLKISKMGGYEELVRKEAEAEKRKLEYHFSDQIQNQIDDIMDSDEFKLMTEYDQEELRQQMDQKREENDRFQRKELEKLDAKLKENSNSELTMQGLAVRLKVNHDMIFDA